MQELAYLSIHDIGLTRMGYSQKESYELIITRA